MRTVTLYIPLVFLLGISGLLFTTCSEETPIEPRRFQTPDFILPDLTGKEVQISDTQGSVVLLNFFADWCNSCRYEATVLNEIYADLHDEGLEIIGVAVQYEDSNDVRQFADTLRVEYTILYGTGEVADAYRVNSIPVTFVIDRDGWIVERIETALSEEEFTEVVGPYLYPDSLSG